MKQMYFYGTGSAINIPLGGIPLYAELHNVEDGDRIDTFFRGKVIAFTSGGTNEVKKGHLIQGATSGARARIRDVLVKSGSWAAGDAAGVFIIDNVDSENTGTFGTEAIYVLNDGLTSSDDASVTAATNISGEAITTAVAAGTQLTAYVGDQNNSKGITIGSTASEDNKLLVLRYEMGDVEIFAAAV